VADEDDGQGADAAEAFEAMRGELALLRRAVEGLAAERAQVPEPIDYSETLGRMAKGLNAGLHRIDVLAKAAEDGVAPRYVADRIVAASGSTRAEDQRTIVAARQGLEDVTRQLHGYVVSGRTGDEQNRWLGLAAIGGAIIGIVLWALLAGPILRVTPDSWRWPERAAARTLGGSAWEGARRLATVNGPDTWNAMVAGAVIGRGNEEALERCQRAATKAAEPVRCTVRIRPEEER
jgi:hypothetical protein